MKTEPQSSKKDKAIIIAKKNKREMKASKLKKEYMKKP